MMSKDRFEVPVTSKIQIETSNRPVDFSIRPPGSKSISNRALICAALAHGTSTLTGILLSDDTHVMIDSLSRLGVKIELNESDRVLKVVGCNGQLPNQEAQLYVDNSGTTIRFLTGMLGVHGGNFRLSGAPRMHERPIGHLVEALRQLGTQITTESPGSCPPVVIESERRTAGSCTVAGEISSQYASGLMLASPLVKDGFSMFFSPPIVSKPYLSMTQQVITQFGIQSTLCLDNDPLGFSLKPNQNYLARDYAIEPDASAASYFWATAAILGGRATVTDLNQQSMQGDVSFVNCLQRMGCQVNWEPNQITIEGKAVHGIDIDMSHISDTAQTLAVVALFVEGPTTIRGIAHNRVKETDRIGNLATELRKLGATVEEHPDGLTIIPGNLRSAEIDTYNDHRMAMSLSLAGLNQEGVVINDPGCTSKTYPEFFTHLNAAIHS